MNDLIPDVVLADNTSQRLPCVLVLDGSTSMRDEAGDGEVIIDRLNAGLQVLEKELKGDDVASQRVQVRVVRVGGSGVAEPLGEWVDAMDWTAPVIEANGNTPLGDGVVKALELIEEQKGNYRDHGIAYNRPWMFIITDGCPNDYRWEDKAEKLREAESEGKVTVFAIGVEGADFDALQQFSNRSPVKLRGLDFQELFVWLSRSVSAGSKAATGDTVQLPAIGWGEVAL